jgi:hypothetical protein
MYVHRTRSWPAGWRTARAPDRLAQARDGASSRGIALGFSQERASALAAHRAEASAIAAARDERERPESLFLLENEWQ